MQKEKEPVTTQEKILIAARKLFVEHGFTGTSVGKIAAEAGINHSLVFHHFGNKQKLWLAVKQDLVAQNNLVGRALPSVELSFKDFLHKLFQQKINFYRNNPDIVRMLNWQRLEYDSEAEIGLSMSKEAKAWIDAIEHYQQQGDIKKNLKPEFILTFLLSLISSAALDPNAFIHSAKNKESYLDFCVQTVLQAFK